MVILGIIIIIIITHEFGITKTTTTLESSNFARQLKLTKYGVKNLQFNLTTNQPSQIIIRIKTKTKTNILFRGVPSLECFHFTFIPCLV